MEERDKPLGGQFNPAMSLAVLLRLVRYLARKGERAKRNGPVKGDVDATEVLEFTPVSTNTIGISNAIGFFRWLTVAYDVLMTRIDNGNVNTITAMRARSLPAAPSLLDLGPSLVIDRRLNGIYQLHGRPPSLTDLDGLCDTLHPQLSIEWGVFSLLVLPASCLHQTRKETGEARVLNFVSRLYASSFWWHSRRKCAISNRWVWKL